MPKFDKAWDDAKKITLETFAKEESPSVQNTMYKMAEQILAGAPDVEAVDYKLPNKHYFEVGESRSFPRQCETAADIMSRPQLVQWPEEHRQRRRSLCAPDRPQRLDRMYCGPQGSFCIEMSKSIHVP